MTRYYLLAFAAVTLTGFAQLFLKIGAAGKTPGTPTISGYPMLFLGLGTMTVAMLLNVRSLSVLPLRTLAFITPVVYILTPVLAFIFLKETPNKNVVRGTIIVIAGMVIFNLRIPILH